MSSLLGPAELSDLPLSGVGGSGPTVLPLDTSVATYLSTVPEMVTLGLVLGTNLFATFIQDEPDQIVVVQERPGSASLLTLAGPAASSGSPYAQSLLDQPVVTVRVRVAQGQYTTGVTLTQQIFGALQGLANTQLPTGGMEFLLLTATGYPAFIGVDTRSRPEWTLTLRTILNNTQRILA